MTAAHTGAGRLPVAAFARSNADEWMGSRLHNFDVRSLRCEFAAQGAFLCIRDFLPPEITAQLAAAAATVASSVNRNYLPGHKRGGSVSRHTIDRLTPFVADLYRSAALIDWLRQLSGESLQLSPAEDPHAYALYFYTRAGDHIGWHYDTSYYAGSRYTVLLGVVDESSCRLDYRLHSRESGATVVPGSLRIAPGDLVFFDGDKLLHRVTPLADSEVRISLTFEYVTDPTMRRWRRVISNMKDAVAYFGFREVFRRSGGA
jgi:alkylated DNA repair dioxygenase AlkB